MIYLVLIILIALLAREYITLDRLIWLDAKVLYLGSFGRYTQGETISALAWDLHLPTTASKPITGKSNCSRLRHNTASSS